MGQCLIPFNPFYSMNPQQKKALYVIGGLLACLLLWNICSTPDDPRHNDWKTYFGEMGDSRNIDQLIEGTDTECDRWEQELAPKKLRSQRKNLPGEFTTTDSDLAERLNQHKLLFEELKKAHTQEQEKLLTDVEKSRTDNENNPDLSAENDAILKQEAESKLLPLYQKLCADSKQFDEELRLIQRSLQNGILNHHNKIFDYKKWLDTELSHLNPRTNMRQKRSEILKAKEIIEKHREKKGGSLNINWSDLLFNLCGGDSNEGGVLAKIDSCRNEQKYLKTNILKAINRNIAMWMVYNEIPQTPDFPQIEINHGDTPDAKLKQVKKALEDKKFTFTPYSYQMHHIDEEARAYCTLKLQEPPTPPFPIKEADYVFGATGDYQNILLEVVKQWAENKGKLGLSAKSLQVSSFKGNHFIEITLPHGSQKDTAILRIIVCNESSCKKIGSPAIDFYLSPSKMGESALIAYDALVFFSHEQGFVLQREKFPSNPRYYSTSALESALPVLVKNNEHYKFLEVRPEDQTEKSHSTHGADTIQIYAYHNVIGANKATLTPITIDDSITIHNSPRFFKPTADNIRMGYYPLAYRVYASTTQNNPPRRLTNLIEFMRSNEESEGQAALKSGGLVGLYPRPYAPRILTDEDIEIKEVIRALKKLKKNDFGYSESDTKIVGVMMGYRALFESNEGDKATETLKKSTQAFVEDEKGANFKEMTDAIRNDIKQYTANFEGNCCVCFVGHADSTGLEERNNTLSIERSKTCKELFGSKIEKYDGGGIPCINFGSGSRMPVGSNNTEIGKKQNRRAEVFLIWSKGTQTYD